MLSHYIVILKDGIECNKRKIREHYSENHSILHVKPKSVIQSLDQLNKEIVHNCLQISILAKMMDKCSISYEDYEYLIENSVFATKPEIQQYPKVLIQAETIKSIIQARLKDLINESEINESTYSAYHSFIKAQWRVMRKEYATSCFDSAHKERYRNVRVNLLVKSMMYRDCQIISRNIHKFFDRLSDEECESYFETFCRHYNKIVEDIEKPNTITSIKELLITLDSELLAIKADIKPADTAASVIQTFTTLRETRAQHKDATKDHPLEAADSDARAVGVHKLTVALFNNSKI